METEPITYAEYDMRMAWIEAEQAQEAEKAAQITAQPPAPVAETPADTTWFKGHSATEWREKAQECRRRSAESWERSDTDGFMSQAASDCGAREYDLCAQIAEDGGTAEFRAAFDLDGTLVAIHTRDGKFGEYFYNVGPAGNGAPRYMNPSQARRAKTARGNDERKGFRLGTVRAVPEVRISQSWTPYLRISNDTDLSEVTVVDDGTQGTQYIDWV